MVGRSDSARILRKELVNSGWSMEASAQPISVLLLMVLYLCVRFSRGHVSRHDGVARDTQDDDNTEGRDFAPGYHHMNVRTSYPSVRLQSETAKRSFGPF